MTTYGPHNPHPLSRLRTELVWEGKYDEYGSRREVDAAGLAMPLQKIETVDEPAQRAAAQMSLFNPGTAHRDDWRNHLIWGDNKLVMASLLKDFKGKIDLIYIDPPFDVGADFTMVLPIGDENDTVNKDQSTLEMVAYRDMWGRGTDSYLHTIFERLAFMKELLAETGSIFVHIGPNISHYIKVILDEIFGSSNYRNEIVLPGRASKNLQQQFETVQKLNVRHDVLFWYSKSEKTRFAQIWVNKHDTGNPEGHWHHLWSNADRPTMRYEIFGHKPNNGQWIWKEERSLQAYENYKRFFEEAGGRSLAEYWRDTGKALEFVRPSPDDGKPQYWRAPADTRMADTMWAGLPIYSAENNYPTEKNEAFLKMILEMASNEGDLVADFFCGSGTTAAVAERLGRRWIACDLGRFAIHTTRKRLIDLQRKLHAENQPYRSFDVYNLGRYERQWWQKERLQGADTEHRRVVLEFFRAEALSSSPSPLLHGRKGPAFVHVDEIDSLFTREEARSVALAAQQAGASEIYCLSWEFEMDLRLHTNALESELGVRLKLIPIPREVMEKNRKSPPPFLEVALLEAEAVWGSRTLTPGEYATPFPGDVLASGKGAGGIGPKLDVKLTRFLPSLAEVPSKELEALKERAVQSGFDFIDFWAVDFDHHPGQPFNHHWQAYRTRKNRSLPTVSSLGFHYEKPGKHTICIKVVDVFGVDTSILLEVEA